MRGDDGAVGSVLVVARDITERTRAEQQIARHARQQKAIAELGRFALETHDLDALMAEAIDDRDQHARRGRRRHPRTQRRRTAT